MIEELLKYSSVISVIVGLFAIIISFYGLTLYKRFNTRKLRLAEKYTALFKDLSTMLTSVYPGKTRNSEITLSEIIGLFQNVTDKYKVAFDNITESNCRISVKIISYEGEEAIIRTLTRNSSSQFSYRIYDKSFRQSLTDYTPALTILNGNKYFLENNIQRVTRHSGYKSISYLNKHADWSLPYKSLLVVPITDKFELNKEIILGLLIIDCDKKNAFDTKVDTEIAKGFADAMSPYLKQINDLILGSY